MTLNEQTNDSYSSLLDQAWDELPDELTFSPGRYRLRCTSAKHFKRDLANDRPETAMFVYTVIEGSKETQAEFEKLDKTAVEATEIYVRFNLKKRYDVKRLNDHMLAHGIKPQPGQLRSEVIEMCRDCEVNAFLEPREYKDKKSGELVVTNDAKEFTPAS